MDSSLLNRFALPGGPIEIDGISDTCFLPTEYKDKQIVTTEEVNRDGLVFIQSVPNPNKNANPKKKKTKPAPCGFYPFTALLNTEDFTHCIGCKGGGCKNLVVRPIDSSQPRACFSNYQVEICGK